jgi:hypothetical protein
MIKLVLWLAAAALVAAWFLARRAAQQTAARAAAWPTASGRVVSSEVTVRSVNGNYYLPLVTYSYTADGTAYASDRLRPGGTPQFFTRSKAQAVADQYPAGSTCVVHYDPRKPAKAALELAPQSYLVLMCAIFAAIVGLTALIVTLSP